MALVPAPSRLPVLVAAPAGSLQSTRLMQAPAGVRQLRLPSGVRAVPAVSRRLSGVMDEETGPWRNAQMTLGLAPRRTEASSGDRETLLRLRARGSQARALGGAAREGGVGDYFGFPDDASRREANQMMELLKLRGRLHVMTDRVPMPEGPELRSLMNEISSVDLAAPIYHWVVPRFKNRLRKIMGDDIYKGVIEPDVDLSNLKMEQTILINYGSKITSLIETLIAQTKYSILHSCSSNSVLLYDHPAHDLSPEFIKRLAGIAEQFFVNIDFLCFTVHTPVTLQQMAANNCKGLLHTYEAVNDFQAVLNPDAKPDMEMMQDLKMYNNKLQSEDYSAMDYLVGLEKHVKAVILVLCKLDKELRTLRPHA